MKKHLKQFISFSLALIIGFFSPLSVYATDEHPWQGGLGLQLYYNKDEIKQYINDTDFFWNYAALQAGATFVDHDFEKFMNNYEKMDEVIDGMGLYKDTSGNVQGVYLPEDFMAQLKELLDQYAKENEPYYIASTLDINDVELSFGLKKNVYDSLVNLLDESPSGLVAFGFLSYSNRFQCADLGHWFTKISPVRYSDNWVLFYNNETWQDVTMDVHRVELAEDDDPIKSWEEVTQRSYENVKIHNLNNGTCWLFRAPKLGIGYKDVSINSFGNASVMPIISVDGRRIRVFNTYGDFQNYTLGRRNIYYTSKYYDYTPAEISVSTKELEQGVKDLNTAMDKLLEQIDKDTPESEVENLLQQILDELKNNGSGSGGGEGPGTDPGTGGGTVDMSTTNSWLSKIYAKVCEIFDRIGQRDTPDQGSVSENSIGLSDINNVLKLIWANTNVIVENLMPGDGQDSVSGNSIDLSHTNSILDSIKAGLDDIHETLKKIKRWTVVDTIVDGADAIADWFDIIHELISDADSGAESVVSTLSSALGDAAGLMKKKFPFSIPWDILFFVTALSAEPEVPQFSIPFDFEISALDLEVHYDLELDFTPFQWLSDLSRLILSMTYAVGLMKMTFDVSNVNKEG